MNALEERVALKRREVEEAREVLDRLTEELAQAELALSASMEDPVPSPSATSLRRSTGSVSSPRSSVQRLRELCPRQDSFKRAMKHLSREASSVDIVMLGIEFRRAMPSTERTQRLKTYKDVFTGREAVDWLVRTTGITREQAVDVGQVLMDSLLFDYVNPSGAPLFKDDKQAFYHLQKDEDEEGEEEGEEEETLRPPPCLTDACRSLTSSSGVLRRFRLPDSAFHSGTDAPNELQIEAYEDYTPLVVFLNRKSGGHQGQELMDQFVSLLGRFQVFDLTQEGPGPGLQRWKGVRDHIILGCGGDGTIGWILSAMDQVDYGSFPAPPVAVLPLGTGNDIGRVTGWGSGYTGERLGKLLQRISSAKEGMLDRWRISITNYSDQQTRGVFMNNYFSIGFDAKIALKFHEAREARPDRFKNRTLNKLYYGHLGVASAVKGVHKLHKRIHMTVDGRDVRLKGIGAVVMLNIPSYGAGTDVWGRGDDSVFESQSLSDGLLEVVGIRNVLHMGQIQGGLGKGIRLAQGKEVIIRFIKNKDLACQVDGEPWRQPPCVVTIIHHTKARFLFGVDKALRKQGLDAVDFTLSEMELEQLEAAFSSPLIGVRARDHVYRMALHKGVFIGKEAVDWIMFYLKLEDRLKAWKAGHFLMERGLFEHITRSHKTFRDQDLFYKFSPGRRTEFALVSEKCLSVIGDPFVAFVRVKVLEGRGLPGKGRCQVQVSTGSQSFTSRQGSRRTDPVWGEEFIFVVGLSSTMFQFIVKNPFVGYFTVPLSVLVQKGIVEHFFLVLDERDKRAGKDHLGEVRVRMEVEFLRGSKDSGLFCGLPPLSLPQRESVPPTIFIGDVNHRCCANLESMYNIYSQASEQHKPMIMGHFEYGMIALKRSEVEVFMQETTNGGAPWVPIGRTTTDDHGRIAVPVPELYRDRPGYYRVRCVVLADFSIAYGQLFLLPKGAEVVILDMDGTITVGDEEVVRQFLAEGVGQGSRVVLQEREAAVTMVRCWAAKGYLPIYLSGRQGSFYSLTRSWLEKKDLPPGPVHLTETHMPTLPVYFSVGEFKVHYMKYITEELGVTVAAVYGNTRTDIRAYKQMGFPKDRTFIAGFFGGSSGTVDIGKGFKAHIATVLSFPDAQVSIPNFSMEW